MLKLKIRKSFQRSLLFILVFAFIGSLLLFFARAETIQIPIESESASIQGRATIQSDDQTSDGRYTEFGTEDETWGGYVKPGAHNTGHDGNLTKTFQCTCNIDQSWLNTNNGGSKVIENVRFNGRVNVWEDGVTIRNFLVDGGLFGIYNGVFEGHIVSGLILEDGELINSENSGLVVSNAEVRRVHAHHQGADAFKPFRNVLLEGNYAHHLGSKAPDVHADGVQMVGGSNITIRGNNFDMKHDEPGFTNSQVMIIQTDLSGIDSVAIDHNWINGGGFSVQLRDKGNGYGCPTNVDLTDNRFGREYQFGLLATAGCGGFNISGNVWDDTGEPVPINND